jgi:hypothetical protein
MMKIELTKREASFVPREMIKGTVSWSDTEGTSLEVRLIWYTVGKGDRDFEVVAVHKSPSFSASGKTTFEFLAPTRPQSFSGKLISLQWAIEAIVFPSKSSERAELAISNTGSEIKLANLSLAEPT